MRPINSLNNKPGRKFKKIKVRPLTSQGIKAFETWIQLQDWKEVLEEKNVDKKAEKLHNMIMNKLDEVCPEKERKISSDNEPWFTEKLEKLKRKKMRIFRKNRNSEKYKKLKKKYENALKEAKNKFKKRAIDDVMNAKNSQWYQKLKRITNFNQERSENVQVDEISHLSDEAQAEAIADSLSEISNQ